MTVMAGILIQVSENHDGPAVWFIPTVDNLPIEMSAGIAIRNSVSASSLWI